VFVQCRLVSHPFHHVQVGRGLPEHPISLPPGSSHDSHLCPSTASCSLPQLDIISPAIYGHHGVVGDAIIFSSKRAKYSTGAGRNPTKQLDQTCQRVSLPFRIHHSLLRYSRSRAYTEEPSTSARSAAGGLQEIHKQPRVPVLWGHSFQLRDPPYRARFGFGTSPTTFDILQYCTDSSSRATENIGCWRIKRFMGGC
jgi:hypothetical protein